MRYSVLVSVYQQLEKTSKRLEKTHLLAEFLKGVPEAELDAVIPLLQGRVFPPWDERTLGFSTATAVKAIALASGETEQRVTALWKKEGDLGIVAGSLVGRKKQATLLSKDVTVRDVITQLQKFPSLEGKGSVEARVKAVAALLGQATAEEARFLVRTVLETLRVGVAEGTLRDAICWTYLDPPITYDMEKKDIVLDDEESRNKYNELTAILQSAYDRCNDYAAVAKAAKTGGLKALQRINLSLGTPVRVMLAQKEPSVEAGLDRVGKPGAVEYKYDGFRLQVHKLGEKVILFTRRLEEVTLQFPEVVAAVKAHITAKSCLLDCEAVGFDPKSGKYMPFQHISQRIKRKYDIEKLQERLPVELNIFDILYLDGKELLNTPFVERRKALEKLLKKPVPRKIRLSEYRVVEKVPDAEKFYKASLAAGNEGIMCKALDGKYQPGSRVGQMVKVKPVLDTMDLVVVAAEWGEGKRSGWLTSFTIACRDESGDLVTIGKVGTGLKELEQEEGVTFEEITKLLKEKVIKEIGREVTVKPSLVLEIAFEEIQRSPSYSSGYALRFPRVIKVREDRGVEDITTLDEVHEAFEHQRGR
jgi:DNA ligase-1